MEPLEGLSADYPVWYLLQTPCHILHFPRTLCHLRFCCLPVLYWTWGWVSSLGQVHSFGTVAACSDIASVRGEDVQSCLWGWHSTCPPLGAGTAFAWRMRSCQDTGTTPCPGLWVLANLASYLRYLKACDMFSVQQPGVGDFWREEEWRRLVVVLWASSVLPVFFLCFRFLTTLEERLFSTTLTSDWV